MARRSRTDPTNFGPASLDVFTSYFALLRKMIRVTDNVLKQAVLHPLSLCKIIEFNTECPRWTMWRELPRRDQRSFRDGRDPFAVMTNTTVAVIENLINDGRVFYI